MSRNTVRKLFLLPVLAGIAAPLPAAAQSGSQIFCFHNDTELQSLQFKLRQLLPNGEVAALLGYDRQFAGSFALEHRRQAPSPCKRMVMRPSAGATICAVDGAEWCAGLLRLEDWRLPDAKDEWIKPRIKGQRYAR
jgi:hypothetical protein